MNPTPPPPLAGRYVLVDQIGAGGMGSVWRAWDLRTQRFVAAKLLTHTDGGMLLRFVREQSVRIQHPHVVAPSGWAAEDHQVVFTMDLVRGGSVHTLLGDHGALPVDYASVVLDQALQALAAVHEAGVVHRDVKPANLLLEPTGTGRPHVRLGDFGIAALMDDVRLTMHPGAIGTEGYMAPEQRLGAPPTPQQDLYALGVVGIQMVTGLGPRQHSGPPPGPLQGWLAWLTHDDPAQRPQSAVVALQALRAIGVPPGAPWRDRPEPPEVFDHIREVAPPSVPSGPNSWPGGQSEGPASWPGGRSGTGPTAVGPTSGPEPLAGSVAPRNKAPLIGALVCFVLAIACAVAAAVLLIDSGGTSGASRGTVCDWIPEELQDRIADDSQRLELLSGGRESFVTCEIDTMATFGYGVKVREDGQTLEDVAGSGAEPMADLSDEALRASLHGLNDFIVAREGDVVVLVRNELVGNTGPAQRPATLSEEVARALLEAATPERVAEVAPIRLAAECPAADAPEVVRAIGQVTVARGAVTDDDEVQCIYGSAGANVVDVNGVAGSTARHTWNITEPGDEGRPVDVPGAVEPALAQVWDNDTAIITWLASEEQYWRVLVRAGAYSGVLERALAIAHTLPTA